MSKKKENKKKEVKPLELDFPTGVVEDTRPKEQKAKDFKSEELFAAPPALTYPDWDSWQKDPENKKLLSTIPVQNQDGSYSCLAQAGALALAINNWLEEKRYERMSARSIYPYRRNNPGRGMWVDDLGNIATQRGVLFEDIVASDSMDEGKMNDITDFLPSYEKIGKIYRAKSYIWLPVNNIDETANILAQGKPVVICVRFGNNEWAKEVPTIESEETLYGHGIVALPKAFVKIKNKKAVLIQDSWGVETGMDGRRLLTEDWFSKGRVQAAIYFEDLQNLAIQNEELAKPVYEFKRDLTMGMRGYDVAMLQRCLGYLKDNDGYMFPLSVEPTGYYGGITRAAVKRFQKENELIQTGNVDSQTRKALNDFFKEIKPPAERKAA